jgi:hypothetical protein
MAANVQTDITLRDKQFRQAIKKAKDEVSGFEGGLQKMSGQIMKFAGTFGLAVGASEVFRKAINSNQLSADLLGNSLETAKTSVNMFFNSLITGDWDTFRKGIFSTIKDIHGLSQTLDDVADRKLSFEYIKAQDLARIAEFETIARDKSLPDEQRKEAAENMKKVVQGLRETTEKQFEAEKKALEQKYSIMTGTNVSIDDFDYFVRFTNFGEKEALEGIENYKKGLEELEDRFEAAAIKASGKTNPKKRRELENETNTIYGQIQAYKKLNEQWVEQAKMINEGDEGRKESFKTAADLQNMLREIANLEKKANRTVNSVLGNDYTPDNDKPIYNPGSLGKLNEDIQALQAQLTAATSEATREGIRNEIAKLNDEKLQIELEPVIKARETLKTDTLKTPETSAFDISPVSAKSDIESGNIVAGASEYIVNYNSEILRSIELQNQWAEGIGTTASGFQSLSTALSQVAGENEEAARTAKAFMMVSQGLSAAQAIYEGVKAGWPAMLFAIPSALASVVSAFAVAGSFESGGIVPGNSFSGDRLTARVNSGEMILNRVQQSNLFGLLNGGGISGGGVERVEVKIKGSDLYASLNNYTKQRSRF